MINIQQSGDTTARSCWNPGMGTPWDQELREQSSQERSSCLAAEGEISLLRWNYHLILRLTHTSTPKLCPGTTWMWHSNVWRSFPTLMISPLIWILIELHFLDRLVGHKVPRFPGVLTDKSNPFSCEVLKKPPKVENIPCSLSLPRAFPIPAPLPKELVVPHTGNGSGPPIQNCPKFPH